MLFFVRFGLFRRDKHIYAAPFAHGPFFHDAKIGAGLLEFFDHLIAEFHMRHLAPLVELERDLDLAALLDEFFCVVEPRVEVVGVDVPGKLHFFGLDYYLLLFFLRLFVFLGFFELVFAVIHDSAYGYLGRRGDLHQIQALHLRHSQRVARTYYPDLAAGIVDDPNLRRFDFTVDS